MEDVEGSVAARLVQVLLAGCQQLLPASDLVALSATCTETRAASNSTPEFWSTLDLSGLANPAAFFCDGVSLSDRFAGIVSLNPIHSPDSHF